MLTDVQGIRVGHADDQENYTGCTVILCPENTVGSGDIRGPAPGSREAALLAPEKPIAHVNAVLLTGGSAFGLAAADGVVRYLEEQGIGHPTPYARVPIVPAAVVYDLFLGGGKRKPDAEMGYQACVQAGTTFSQGAVGAGTGVTVGKWAGFETMMKGGVGTASQKVSIPGQDAPLVVAALAVTNSVGDLIDQDGSVLAGARRPGGGWLAEEDPLRRFPDQPPAALTNTTLVVVATNARLNKVEAHRLAQRAHDGLAMSIFPVHTTHDGDSAFALATGQVSAPLDVVANTAVFMVAEAVRNGGRFARTTAGVPGLAE